MIIDNNLRKKKIKHIKRKYCKRKVKDGQNQILNLKHKIWYKYIVRSKKVKINKLKTKIFGGVLYVRINSI